MAHTLRILHVDDDDVVRDCVRRAFQKNAPQVELVQACDGIEALEILRGDHLDKAIARPYIVLLDLNMPRMSGHELLDAMRADAMLRRVAVFVLTTSDAPEDIKRSYDTGVAGYLVKSELGTGYRGLCELLSHYLSLSHQA